MARMGRYTAARPAEAQNPMPPVRQIAAHVQNGNDARAAGTGGVVVAGDGIIRTCVVVQAAGPALTVVSADFDGDSVVDLAVFHRATAKWYISYSGGGGMEKAFGWSAMVPVPADYDGDGKADSPHTIKPAASGISSQPTPDRRWSRLWAVPVRTPSFCIP